MPGKPWALTPLIALAMLAGPPSGVTAQGVDDLRPGARVRLYPEAACPRCSVTGRLERLEGRRLELTVDEALLSFPLDSIRALEVSHGKSWVPPVVGGVGVVVSPGRIALQLSL